MTDSELQTIVEKYFNHINGVEHLMPNFPKPEPKPYPPVMLQSDLMDIPAFPKKNADFWDRVEEQRLAGLQKAAAQTTHPNDVFTMGVGGGPGRDHNDGITLINRAHPDGRSWSQKYSLYVLLTVAVIGTALFFPEILEVIEKIQ